MEVSASSFEFEVIEASHTTPVLVDFWAPWCGPCRVLGPILEKLAAENEGRWKLVKISTDQNPELSARYRIQGIPAVKLFSGGEVVDEFTGALPEYAITQWLQKALPGPTRRLIELASMFISEGNEQEAERVLTEVLGSDPDNPEARIMLAGLIVFNDPERAQGLLGESAFAGAAYMQLEDSIKVVTRLLALGKDPASLPESPGRDTYISALEAMGQQDFDRALSLFIEVVRTNRSFDDDGARRACIALFTLLGPEHPATLRHRRIFDMSLY